MNAKKALIVLLVYGAALGVMISVLSLYGIREPEWAQVGSTLAFSLLTFWWYYLDSGERAYRRGPLLNVAVVGIGLLAIPYYLVRSRARGERLKALAKCIGFVALWVVAVTLGVLPAALLSQS